MKDVTRKKLSEEVTLSAWYVIGGTGRSSVERVRDSISMF